MRLGSMESRSWRWVGQGVEFNLSHSRGWAAIAVTRVGRIGVDIEGHRGFRHADNLAKTILSARELELYGSLAQVEQETFLIRSWTLKEAVLKGMGVGLAVNPRVRWNWLGSIPIRLKWCRWGEGRQVVGELAFDYADDYAEAERDAYFGDCFGPFGG